MFDGLVIGGVVVLNAIIGFVQEYRASKAIKALSAMAPLDAIVIRDGRERTLPASELVPGDVVLLKSGDKVPADMRLIEERSLMVEEAALTGESMPVEKAAAAGRRGRGHRRPPLHGLQRDAVTYGTAKAAVVATGAGTELGRISKMLGQASELETPLTRQLGVIARWIALAIVVVSVILLGVGLLRGYALGDAVLAAVTLAVAAIPEGPAGDRHHLARHRRAAHGAPSRHRPQAAGSRDAGLDHGDLHRQDGHADAQRDDGAGAVDAGGQLPPERHRLRARRASCGTTTTAPVREIPATVEELVRAGALCNDAAVHEEEEGWQATGDPTEGALVVAARKLGLPADALRERWPRRDAIPFESERQFMATLHDERRRRPGRLPQGRARGRRSSDAATRRATGRSIRRREPRGRADRRSRACVCSPSRPAVRTTTSSASTRATSRAGSSCSAFRA